jgi:hypothetical protein
MTSARVSLVAAPVNETSVPAMLDRRTVGETRALVTFADAPVGETRALVTFAGAPLGTTGVSVQRNAPARSSDEDGDARHGSVAEAQGGPAAAC